MNRPDFAGTGMSNLINSSDNMDDDNTSGGINIHVGNGRKAGVAGNLGGTSVLSNLDVSEEDTKPVGKHQETERCCRTDLQDGGTDRSYPEIPGTAIRHVRKYGTFPATSPTQLTNVSDTLLNSYKSITDNSDGINQNSRGYVQQMEMLNRNISGLNTHLRNTVKEYQFADRIDRTYQRRPEPHPRDVRRFGNRQLGLPQRNGKDDSPAGRTEPGIQPFATGNDGQYGSGNRLPAACPQPQQPNYQQQQPNYQQPYQQQPYGYQQQAPYTNNPGQQSGR